MTQTLEGHTVHRFDGELSHLHMLLLEMGGLVLDQLRGALQALSSKDTEFALKIIDRDNDVDSLEVQTDREVLKIIARRTPVARDLRTVMVCSKAVTDLERAGDEASRIAKLALPLLEGNGPDPSDNLLRDIPRIGQLSTTMLEDSLAALDRLDIAIAEKIAAGHPQLDAEFQSSLRRLATFIMEDSRNVGHAIRVVLIIKALERIGQHSTNIAEQIIYLIRGEDVRHRRDRYRGVDRSTDSTGRSDLQGETG
jgi:phosphate transport system protein